MRWLLISTLFATILITGTSREAAAQWCAFHDEFTYTCGFKNLRQCLDTLSGIGGECRPDPFLRAPSERERKQPSRSPNRDRR